MSCRGRKPKIVKPYAIFSENLGQMGWLSWKVSKIHDNVGKRHKDSGEKCVSLKKNQRKPVSHAGYSNAVIFQCKTELENPKRRKGKGEERCSQLFFSFPPLPLHSCRKIPLNFSLNNKCRKLLKAYEVGVYFLVPNSKAVGLEEKYTLKGWMIFWIPTIG